MPSRRTLLVAWGVLAALLVPDAVAGEAAITSAPLEVRSGPRGRTLFAEVPSAVSGVVTTNDFADPKMWGERYREFEVGAMGTGIAIGDYDGDGKPDVFVVSKTESCRLFRNLGGFKFEDVTALAGVGDVGDTAKIWKQGAAFVDINNDGRLDLYVCRFGAPNRLYLNQGDGTFRESAHAYGLDVSDASVMACFCDYDRDGWLDVFIVTNLLDAKRHPNGQANYLFHNNRDGTFTNVTARAGIGGEGQAHSAVWWDFDEDGWPDLYLANDFAAPDQLYRNNHDGTFRDILGAVVPHTPFSSMGSDVADVDNDGHVDLFVADMAATSREKDQRGMADSRGRTIDDQLEPRTPPQYERNALLLNTGRGRMREAAQLAGLAASDWTWSPRFEDLDDDGRVDLFVTNGMYRESTNVDLLARQMSAETMADRMRIMRDSPVLAERNLARRNLGDLRFEDVGAAWGLDQRGVSFGSAFGDLDGDGDLDVVFANYQKGVTILRNDSATNHRVNIALRGTVSNRFGIGAVVRIETATGVQVRPLVLARGYMSTSEPVVHFGLGDATVIPRLTVQWPSGQRQTFENLAADRRYLVTESDTPALAERGKAPNGASPATAVSADRGSAAPGGGTPMFTEASGEIGLAGESREDVVDDTALQPLIPVRLNRRGPALASARLAPSGPTAVVVGGTTLTPLQVFVTHGATLVPVPDAVARGAMTVDDGPMLLFDANSDGATDLLMTKGGATLPAGAVDYQPTLWLGDGRGHFRPADAGAMPSLPISAGAAVAADFDRDGALDVFIGGRVAPGQYPSSPRSALLRNRGGVFEDVTDRLAPELRNVGLVTSALWTDVDGDGWIDLLVATEWGSVRYFRNVAGQRFDDRSSVTGFATAGNGWWTSLAGGDFNGDGRMDYAVGNAGLNTPYQSDPAHPATLFLGNFGGDDDAQVIEARYDGDTLYPVRSRRALGAALPAVLRRFPKNNAYAAASLADLLGADRLSAARRFTATELRSGVFLSQPNGTYRFEALPRVAQIAPLQGMLVADFNGDGQADIYAVQNSYAPIPSVGRYDGGLSQLLLGDGRGHFEPVPPEQSGLLVSGDAKALIAWTTPGSSWPGCIVSRNNDTMLAFRNGGTPGDHALAVQLRGERGNPAAIGARITLTLADGSTQLAEICAGSGYYSQSDGTCYLGYRAGNPPRRVDVRWPDGTLTTREVAATATDLVIER